MEKKFKENYDFFLQLDVTEYGNKWLAIVNLDVIAKDTFEAVYNEAKKKYPKERPLIAKIPGIHPNIFKTSALFMSGKARPGG